MQVRCGSGSRCGMSSISTFTGMPVCFENCRACHWTAEPSPRSSSIEGRRPIAMSRSARSDCSARRLAPSRCSLNSSSGRGAKILQTPQLHAQRGQHLADLIVKLAGNRLALLLLRLTSWRDSRRSSLSASSVRTRCSAECRLQFGHAEHRDCRQSPSPSSTVIAEHPADEACHRSLPAVDLRRCWSRFACVSREISRVMRGRACRRGSISRRRKPQLRAAFSSGVHSKSGSSASQ